MAILKNILDEKRVVLFMNGSALSPRSWFSMISIEILKMCNTEFKVIDVSLNPKLKKEVAIYSCWSMFPQLFVGGEFIGGSHVMIEMYQSRNLQILLHEE